MSNHSASSNIHVICDAYERSWQNGSAPPIEAVLQEHGASSCLPLLEELIAIEAFHRARCGERVSEDDYRTRFPEIADHLLELLRDAKKIADRASSEGAATTHTSSAGERTFAHGVKSPANSPVAGQQLGHYRLVKRLGAGGMGIVWEAVHLRLEKTVALKLLAPHFLTDPAFVSRFDREMKAVGKVEHPHLVRAYDAGEDHGTHYLAMEYIDGMDLARYVRERGPLTVPQTLQVMIQAASGLAEAHRAQLIHRDIKPANLMLTRDGVVKITDLGLARLQNRSTAEQDGSLTSSGQILGTPDFMAPEQWDDTHTADARSDLYSLGCTLFYLLMGRAPYSDPASRSFMSKMKAHVTQPIPDLKAMAPQVPDELIAIFQKLMAKDPAERFQTAVELLDALRTFMQSQADVDSPPTAPALIPRSDFRQTAITTNLVIANRAEADTPVATQKPPNEPPRFNIRALYGLGGLAALILFAVIIVTITNKDGTKTVLKVPEGVETEVKAAPDSKVLITQSSLPNETPPSTPDPPSAWHGWPADAPPPAVAPFDRDQANDHQEAWAKFLRVPVEYTNSIGMRFRLIPPGEFLMGSTKEEIEKGLKAIDPNDKAWQERLRSEAPQHQVILTQPVYFSVHEVTQADYEHVMKTNPAHFSHSGSGKEVVAGMDTSHHPVETVSSTEAATYCTKLSVLEKLKPFDFRAGESVQSRAGTGYRLPSEAEWEFACAAGTTTRYWNSDRDEDLVQAGWFGQNAKARTHQVGELKANPFGLFDTHGNVYEWVLDGWDVLFYDRFDSKPAIDPISPLTAAPRRIIRGGNWNNPGAQCRSAGRYFVPAAFRNSYVGFRVTLPVDAVKAALGQKTETKAVD